MPPIGLLSLNVLWCHLFYFFPFSGKALVHSPAQRAGLGMSRTHLTPQLSNRSPHFFILQLLHSSKPEVFSVHLEAADENSWDKSVYLWKGKEFTFPCIKWRGSTKPALEIKKKLHLNNVWDLTGFTAGSCPPPSISTDPGADLQTRSRLPNQQKFPLLKG